MAVLDVERWDECRCREIECIPSGVEWKMELYSE